MNQAAYHIANRKEFQRTLQIRRFFNTERGLQSGIFNKECIVSGKVALPRGTEGTCQADCFTSVDQVILC